MATKRKPTTEDPIMAIRKLVRKIRKELSCTEGEAHYTLRSIVHPHVVVYSTEIDSNPTLDWALSNTKGILEMLNEHQAKAEKGDIAGLFDAVVLCGHLEFPLPEWATERLWRAWHNYNYYAVKTLDEAFGNRRKLPRNFPFKKAAEAVRSFDVYWRCKKLHDDGLRIGNRDADLFEKVAEEVGMSRTKVSEYYYFWLKHPSGSYDPLSVPELIKPLLRPKARGKAQPE